MTDHLTRMRYGDKSWHWFIMYIRFGCWLIWSFFFSFSRSLSALFRCLSHIIHSNMFRFVLFLFSSHLIAVKYIVVICHTNTQQKRELKECQNFRNHFVVKPPFRNQLKIPERFSFRLVASSIFLLQLFTTKYPKYEILCWKNKPNS